MRTGIILLFVSFTQRKVVNAHSTSTNQSPVLILDVDNTFYSEEILQKIDSQSQVMLSDQMKSTGGIEQQIIKNTYSFCQDHLQMSPEECDEMFYKYGSTPEGLRVKITDKKELKIIFDKFYKQVYQGINLKSLLKYSHRRSEDEFANTGYTHSSKYISQSQQINDLLEQIQSKFNQPMIYLASNSPYLHIVRVLKAMGLYSFPFAGIITPDFWNKHNSTIKTGIVNAVTEDLIYPTKASPNLFFRPILNHISPQKRNIAFMDDSKFNLENAKKSAVGFNAFYHIRGEYDLVSALKDYILTIENGEKQDAKYDSATTSRKDDSNNNQYQFSENLYLASKNKVDTNSINRKVWIAVISELSNKLKNKSSETVTIVDLGAGLLSALDFFLNGFADGTHGLLENMNESQKIIYYAYESHESLQEGCKQKLIAMGFQEIQKEENIVSYQHSVHHVNVHLVMNDFRSGHNKASNLIEAHGNSPDLIVGCCFADLFPSPRELISCIMEIACANTSSKGDRNSSTMLYFPITFAGTTLLHPPQPFATSEDTLNTMMIPSDTFALRSYSHILEKDYQHNLDHTSIIRAAENFGMSLVSSGPSDWNIDPKEHSYLWDTMRFFFKSVIDNNIKEWNMKGWHDRVLRTRPSIVAKNVDLLFRLDSSQKMGVINEVSRSHALHEHRSVNEMEEIEFTEPYKVHSVKKSLGNSKQALGPNEIKVQSICSLISSGTELKIFRGTFDNTEPLDVNIKGMSDTAMAYPLSYGYSLVGRIIGCGSPKNKHLLGEHVFTFSPHSSHLICDLSSVHIVPKGIAPEDAMFLPSVETALSIVHDAHIRMGERVGVFGQGLIGLLVTSILSLNKHEMKTDINGMLYGTVTVFDTILDRLAASSAVGASEALLPSSAMDAGPFDVTIEVSGNGRALQTAIDATRAHGRIIIGSWYGSTDVNLKLGMEFHRSHKTLLATQVSEIPPGLRGLWNKERRFNLSWELVRLLRPSKHLVTRWEELGNAQQAYDALDKGKEISVAFRYNTK